VAQTLFGVDIVKKRIDSYNMDLQLFTISKDWRDISVLSRPYSREANVVARGWILVYTSPFKRQSLQLPIAYLVL